MGIIAQTKDNSGHFLLLDGMRGVAAIMVVFYHLFSGIGYRLFGTSILAVDFFFMLSGFVIAHSYEHKFHQGFPFKKFMTLRIIRLSPMIFFGALLGLFNYELLCYLDKGMFDLEGITNFFLTIFMLPQTLFGQNSMFVLNNVLWSLFFEYVAYILFALFLFRLPTKILAIVCLMAFGLFANWIFSSFGANSPRFDNPGFWDGFSRVIFSFPMGMLIYRLHREINFSNHKILFSAFVLFIAFLELPREAMPQYFYYLSYAFLAPTIIFLGANVVLGEKSQKIADFMGEISYPLYQIHFQILWLFVQGLQLFTHKSSLLVSLTILFIPILVWIAYIVSRKFDIPVRAYLKSIILQESVQNQDEKRQMIID